MRKLHLSTCNEQAAKAKGALGGNLFDDEKPTVLNSLAILAA
jgi:hypothetical protein